MSFKAPEPELKPLNTLALWDKSQSPSLDINLGKIRVAYKCFHFRWNYALTSKFPGKLITGKQPLEDYFMMHSAFLIWNLPAIDIWWKRKLTKTAEKGQTQIKVLPLSWTSHDRALNNVKTNITPASTTFVLTIPSSTIGNTEEFCAWISRISNTEREWAMVVALASTHK